MTTKLYQGVCPTCGDGRPLPNKPYTAPVCEMCGSPMFVFGPPREAQSTPPESTPTPVAVPPLEDDAFDFPALTGTAW